MLESIKSFFGDILAIPSTASLAIHLTSGVSAGYAHLLDQLRAMPMRERVEAERWIAAYLERDIADMIRSFHRNVAADELGVFPRYFCALAHDINPHDPCPQMDEYRPVVLACMFLHLGIPAYVVHKNNSPEDDLQAQLVPNQVRVLVPFDDIVRFALRQ